jgi:biopolymer transport protein ExbD
MSWKRILGLALASVALALIVWGLFFAIPGGMVSIKIDLPPAEGPPAKPKPAPKPVTISVDGSGGVHVQEGAPPDHAPAEPAGRAKP